MLLAIQFLTLIPVKVRGSVSGKDMAASTVFFPLAGACQGLIMVLAGGAALQLFSPGVACGLILLAHILTNGGFDLDGLADTADALSVKSSGDPERDREKRLAVMKDSAVGPSGAVAITMSLLLKFLLLTSLAEPAADALFLSFVFSMAVFSKWVTVPAMIHSRPARKDGLGSLFSENIVPGHLVLSSLLLVAVAAAPFLASGRFGPGSVALLLAALFLSCYLLSLAAAGFFRKIFGGMTGDTFGALSEVSEIIYLMVAYLWLRHST